MSQLIRFLRLFSIFSLVQSQTDNCPVIKCDKDPSGQNGCIYTGMIKPDQLNTDNGAPILAGESERDAISVMVGCYLDDNTASDGNFPTDLIVPPEYEGNFTFNIKREGPRTQLLQLTATYDIVTSMEISFVSKACSRDNQDNCLDITFIIAYSFNNYKPTFNPPVGSGKLEDAASCPMNNNQATEECRVKFDQVFEATDGDGDVIVYSVIPVTDVSASFGIEDNRDLSTLYYNGAGVSEGTTVQLLIQAMDLRSIDGKTEVGVVNIEVGTTGTAPPNPNTTTPPPTDKDNEQLYFILMIVFACLFGLTLLLIICTPIIIKLCRKDNVFNLTGALSKKAHLKNSGVIREGATFKSFSEMDYGNDNPSYEQFSNTSSYSSPELEAKMTTSGRVKSKTSNSRSINVDHE